MLASDIAYIANGHAIFTKADHGRGKKGVHWENKGVGSLFLTVCSRISVGVVRSLEIASYVTLPSLLPRRPVLLSGCDFLEKQRQPIGYSRDENGRPCAGKRKGVGSLFLT